MSTTDIEENDIELEQSYKKRWNYYVIREIWKACKPRGTTNDLYRKELNVQKRYYGKLIVGEDVPPFIIERIKKQLFEKAGVSKKIFDGQELLAIFNISNNELKNYLDDIATYNEKKEQYVLDYIKLKNKLKKDTLTKKEQSQLNKPIKSDNLKEFEARVKQAIKSIDIKVKDTNVLKLWYYFKNGDIFHDSTNVIDVIGVLEKLNLDILETADVKTLKQYLNILEQQHKMAQAAMIYKENSK